MKLGEGDYSHEPSPTMKKFHQLKRDHLLKKFLNQQLPQPQVEASGFAFVCREAKCARSLVIYFFFYRERKRMISQNYSLRLG
jgi:hypothetical protein